MKAIRFLVPVIAALSMPIMAAARDCRSDFDALTAQPLISDMLADYPGASRLGDQLPVQIPDEGWCQLDDLRFAPDQMDRFTPGFGIDSIRWQADWQGGSRVFPPPALRLHISGLHQIVPTNSSPNAMSAELAYQLRLQRLRRKTDLTLEYRYDAAENRLDLTKLDLDGPGPNDLILAASLHHLPARIFQGDLPDKSELIAITLTEADLTLRNRDYFQSQAFFWLRLVYPRLGDTPETAVEHARRLAIQQIGAWPDAVIDAPSRDALVQAIDTLPNPDGTLHLHLAAPGHLGAADMMAMAMAGDNRWQVLAQRQPGLRLDAEWQTTVPQERR